MNRTTMHKKIAKIEQDVARAAIVPPSKLLPYLEGRKIETNEEYRRVRRMFSSWNMTIERAIKTGGLTLQETLDGLPEPFKTDVIEALRRKIAKDKASTSAS